ncbi:hypothetical protein ENSA5_01340 [Enhygromyxa salina]|uniref:Uncharacterized protein n=2 Tax=Enhygromyxa salina TaxID=215803 RepID=A0A2S9YL76_9BACT|nr:hypothetical protein ENSA5_01340 [Enhygromyxa salina]
MGPREQWWFTPVLWKSIPQQEYDGPHEWAPLRERFASASPRQGQGQGHFDALDGLVEVAVGLQDLAAKYFAMILLGAAGSDRHLAAARAYIYEDRLAPNVVELCEPLAVWGRLTAVETILWVYDRHFGAQCAEGIPAYLTTMLEPEFGPAADYPREDTLEAYEAAVRTLHQQRVAELGDPNAYVLFGERFGTSPYELMMQPLMRRRFEVTTGIDCSHFYVRRDFQPLTAAAHLEAWLDSSAPDHFIPGERYFFGHHIPRDP